MPASAFRTLYKNKEQVTYTFRILIIKKHLREFLTHLK